MSNDDKNSEVFETFRQYWNSCEEMKLAPEYGRIYAIFKSAALPSQLAPDVQDALDLRCELRILAEGSDWKRDSGERLKEWALRTLAVAIKAQRSSTAAPFCYRLTAKANGARMWQDTAPDAWDIKNCDIVPLYAAPVSATLPLIEAAQDACTLLADMQPNSGTNHAKVLAKLDRALKPHERTRLEPYVDPTWEWVKKSCETNADHAVLVRLNPDGNYSFLHGDPTTGVVQVDRLAWEGFVGMVNARLGKPANRDKTPAELIEMARAMLASVDGTAKSR